jgi:hypothetical protein
LKKAILQKIKWLSPAHRKRTRFPQPSISSITQLAPIKSLKNEDFLRQKYLEEGLSLQEIAAEAVFSWKTVRRHLLCNKVPLKPKDRLRKEQIKFGFERVEGQLQKNENEQATLRLMFDLRNQGLTIREIVKTLNESNTPTRTAGGRWHVKTVLKCLAKNT